MEQDILQIDHERVLQRARLLLHREDWQVLRQAQDGQLSASRYSAKA
jgi:hypothetical protein